MTSCAPVQCATYRVTIRNRRTSTLSPDCPDLTNRIDGLTFRWTKNATSTCDLAINLETDDDGRSCCDCTVRTWRDVVTVERVGVDGDIEGLAWEGPVTRVQRDPQRGQLLVFASDWSVETARRPESRTAITGGLDEAELWFELFVDAMRGGFGVLIPTSWTPTTKKVPTAIDAATLTKAGTNTAPYLTGDKLSTVSWCVIGRTVHGPGPNIDGDGTWGTFQTTVDWDEPPVVEEDGATVASQMRLLTKDADNNDLIGTFPPKPVVDPDLGLHVVSQAVSQGAWTQESINEEAKVRWQAHQKPDLFVVTSSASLSDGSKACVWDLRPGRKFRLIVDDACDELNEVVQIFNLVVECTPDEEGALRETRVAVDFNRSSSLSLPVDLLSI